MKFNNHADDDFEMNNNKKVKKSYVKNRKEDQNWSAAELNDKAIELLSKNVDHKDILGYVNDNNEYVKYDKDSELQIKYIYKSGVAKIISNAITPYREFNGTKSFSYKSEI